ncbi:MAG TPA: diheme cytochrome c [Casimicrobiaceae bacterium]
MIRTRSRFPFRAIALGAAIGASAWLAAEASASGGKTTQATDPLDDPPTLAAGAAALPPAGADSRLGTALRRSWQAECGSCHVAYPPRLLPARSWRALMSDLDRHFGTSASVDAAAGASILAFLQANAGRDRSPAAPPLLRITESPWFVREHDEVAPAEWRSPKVKSAANCGACHPGAESGRFGEHDVRIPR